ncbi:MAG TPA: hypothetical protein PLY93_06005 [Turneriella sp.]|nr:hypothetical protein [Turneriella sp.]
MPWPYLFFNFVAFTLLYSGHVVAGITTLVTEAAFFVLDARRAGRKLLFPVLLGLLLGFSLFILRLPYLSLTNHNFESGEAVVTAVSRKSVVIARVDKIKLRLIGIPKEKLPAN